MKRIVIACDGTWNRADAPRPTNVVKLAQAVAPRALDGTVQLTIHLDGVGSGRGGGRAARALDRAFGGVFGAGLEATLAEAYRGLALNLAPGDEIFLFGFSRGAFTARSLAGLIRTAGVVRRDRLGAIPEAFALYRRRGPGVGPDDAAARAFRTRNCAGGATRLRYLGVWDTVGALGLPGRFRLAALANRGLRFHDTALSGRVGAARHAVALDERRRAFAPTLWDNLDALNAGAAGTPYRQRWFPGDHGSVGGGGPETGLSDDAALWVMAGAAEAGLALDPDALARLAAGRDFRAPLRNGRRGLLAALLRHRPAEREGPARIEDLAPAAAARWRADPAYRPAALVRLAATLGHNLGHDDAARPRRAIAHDVPARPGRGRA